MEFVPIRLGDYVRRFLKSNRGETATEVTARLRAALEAYRAGKLCDCGEPIWVIGSAEVGHACFTCITGEAEPSSDYEIAEACDKHRFRSRDRRRRRPAWLDPPSMSHDADRPPAAPGSKQDEGIIIGEEVPF
jgi:hypothetical protein